MLKEKFRLAKDYLQFRMGAYSRFSIHSPFLFELVNDVFRDKRSFYAFNDIEKLRRALLSNPELITEPHIGEQSKSLAPLRRRVCDVAKVTTVPEHYGQILFRLVNHLQPASVLEMGTGTGISSLYLASATVSPCITLEGSPALSKIAREQFAQMQLKNIELLEGNFSETLPIAIQRFKQLHFVFIDGNHNKTSLLGYMQQIVPYLADNATVVIDDIYWSEEMKEAWQQLIKLPGVTLSIDLFRMGILFFRSGIKVKQDLKVVISV